jgi:hypothetical protein
MRSIFIDLIDTKTEDVKTFLTHLCGDPAIEVEVWNYPGPAEECVLMVSCHDYSEYDPEEFNEKIKAIGKIPTVCICVDITGRVPGDKETNEFCKKVLKHFKGFASDDYTEHAWSLKEIEEGAIISGHPFFDYRGWYEQSKNR